MLRLMSVKAKTGDPNSGASIRISGSRIGHWSVEICNFSDLDTRVGRPLLAAFLKCFVGIDRITTFQDLIRLNAANDGAISAPGTEGDAPQTQRNIFLLNALLAGTLYEIGDALHELSRAGVVDSMSDPSLWQPLDQMRKRWQKAKVPGEMRNQIAHHLGDLSVYETGVGKLSSLEAPVEFARGIGQSAFGAHHIGPWNALTQGLRMEDHEFRTLSEGVVRDHQNLAESLMEVFLNVLDAEEIPLADLRR
jgi:hypothetical protein